MTSTVHTPTSPAASPVDEALTHILQGSDFPAFAQQMREVMAALDHPESSTQRVVNVVLRDYGLTVKLIRASNSMHFNRTGRPIRSATHALLLLGARTARSIASSLMLFEHYQGKSPGLKQLMLLSLLSANHAREVALRVAGAEAEEALLAGMFRNLGEVLVAAHFPDAYARVLAKVQQEGRAVSLASFNVLGYQFEDLGEAMARHWGMPEGVSRVIRGAAQSNASLLTTITAFSHDLTSAIYRRDASPGSADATAEAINETVARYGTRLQLTRDDVRAIVESAVKETRDVFAGARVSFDDLRLRRQTAVALEALGGQSDGSGVAGRVTPSALALGANGEPLVRATPGGGDAVPPLAVVREQLLSELDASVGSASGLTLDKALLLALETLVRGGPFDRALFIVVNPERTEAHARFGLGEGVDALVASFRFPLSSRGGAIGIALARREELVMFEERAARREEARILRQLGARGAALVPLVLEGKLLGCLYVDRVHSNVAPDHAALVFTRRVRMSAAHAIEERRSRATPAAAVPGAQSMTAEFAVMTSLPAAPEPTRPDDAGPPPLTAAAKAALVIRMLRGESTADVAQSSGVGAAQLEAWRGEFLTGAVKALGD